MSACVTVTVLVEGARIRLVAGVPNYHGTLAGEKRAVSCKAGWQHTIEEINPRPD